MSSVIRLAASSFVVVLSGAANVAAQSSSPSFHPPAASMVRETTAHMSDGGAAPIAALTLVPQRTRWALGVKVGGQPFRFGLDIGGGITLMSTRAAGAAGCTPSGRIALPAAVARDAGSRVGPGVDRAGRRTGRFGAGARAAADAEEVAVITDGNDDGRG